MKTNRWLTLIGLALVMAIGAIGCPSPKPKDDKKRPKYGYPIPADWNQYGGPYLSSAHPSGASSTLQIVDAQAYKKFLFDVVQVCRENSNKGIFREWHWGTNNCNQAASQYSALAIDLYAPTLEPHNNAPTQVDFFVGAPSRGGGFGYGGSNIQWISQAPIMTSYKLTDSSKKFRLLAHANGTPHGSKLEIRSDSLIKDMDQPGDIMQIEIEYDNKVMARGSLYRLN